MSFEITVGQREKIKEWLKIQDQELLAQQRKALQAKLEAETDPDERENLKADLEIDVPYSGTIGGAVTYQFTPTSLGVILKVLHSGTKKELDLTDYESW